MGMDLSKLNGLSTLALIEMRDHCTHLIKQRGAAELKIGCTARFNDGMVDRELRVHRINSKTVSGVEVYPEGGRKWRVGIGGLTVIPKEEKRIVPQASKGSDKPAVESDW